MLCVHKAIKGPAELVTIMKLDGIMSLSDVSAIHCFVITTIAIRMLRQGISPPNSLVTQHRLNDHLRRTMVQGDGDHDLCTGGSYVEVMVVLTST
jgi:hypothetical protein